MLSTQQHMEKKPTRIDPKLTLHWASQNVRGIIPKEQDPKLAAGIETLMKLHTLTKSNMQNHIFQWQQHQ
jgi:hypothetical protein